MIKTKYPESIEESGNYLRITLQNISDNHLSYNPISYLLLYEYAMGRNEQLVIELDQMLEKKESIDDEIINSLFKKYFADQQFLLAEKKAEEFQKILMEVTRNLSRSGTEINRQLKVLDDYATKLNHATSFDEIVEIAKRIVTETKSMANSSRALANQFDSTVSEIDILREELEGVKQIARTDTLTRLLNRRGFDETWAAAQQQLSLEDKPLSIVMLDIDHFKKINDTFGHLIGDNVLKMIGKLLKDQTKGKDIVARYGGEEFILLLPETNIEDAYILAEQIRLSLQEMNWKTKKSGKSLGRITVSLGISLYRKGEQIGSGIKRADSALYHAKSTGRNKTSTELDMNSQS
ncbi:MAG: GGDEF domain-containing protein [Desulfobacteraceae bacterium]|nr:GGDEF domain-containing protein [Desulfobacteraceae bacterium]